MQKIMTIKQTNATVIKWKPSVNVYDINKKQSLSSGKPENDNIKIKSNGDSKPK